MKVYEACGGVAHLVMIADEVEMANGCHYVLEELEESYEGSRIHAINKAGSMPFKGLNTAWMECRHFPKPHEPRNLRGIIGKSLTSLQCLEVGACSRTIG